MKSNNNENYIPPASTSLNLLKLPMNTLYLTCSILSKPFVIFTLKKVKLKKLFKSIMKVKHVRYNFPTKLFCLKQEYTVQAMTTIHHKGEVLIVVGSNEKIIKLYRFNSSDPVLVLKDKSLKIVLTLTTIKHGDEKLIISGSRDRVIKIWSIKTPETPLFNLKSHTDIVLSICTVKYNDEFLVVSGSKDCSVMIWNLHTPDKPIFMLKGHTGSVFSLLYLYNLKVPKIISGSFDTEIKVWGLGASLDHCNLITTLNHHTASINSLAKFYCVYTQEEWVVSGSDDKTIKIWNLEKTMAPIFSLPNTEGILTLTTMMLQGEVVIACGSYDKKIKIWNIYKDVGKPVHEITDHSGSVMILTTFEFQNEIMLASGSYDKTLMLFR